MFENFIEGKIPDTQSPKPEKNEVEEIDKKNRVRKKNKRIKQKKEGVEGADEGKDRGRGRDGSKGKDNGEDIGDIPDQWREAQDEIRSASLLDIYLKDIRSFPLLTPEEEISLAACIKENNQRVSELIERVNKLDAEAKKLPEGDSRRVKIEKDSEQTKKDSEQAKKDSEQAEEKFINSNLRLVVSIAKKYYGFKIPLLDLIQEGNIGLIKAVESFDYTRGYKFSTYATPKIHAQIMRMIIERSHLIRIPHSIYWLIPKMKEVEKEYFLSSGKMPTQEYLAEKLGVTTERIRRIQIAMLVRNISSLDALIRDDSSSTREDFISGEIANISENEAFARKLFREALEDALETHLKDDREREVLKLLCGLGKDGRFYTLKEIGVIFKITGESVRQIKIRAIGKLTEKIPQLRKQLEGLMFYAQEAKEKTQKGRAIKSKKK